MAQGGIPFVNYFVAARRHIHRAEAARFFFNYLIVKKKHRLARHMLESGQSHDRGAVMKILKISSALTAVAMCVMLSACASNPSNSQIGAVTGAVVGGLAGSALTGGSTGGAVVGAGVGAAAGHEIGKRVR